MSLLMNMIKQRENLSVSEKAVLDYLIENKGSLKDLSVESIAKAVYTSPASVVRMSKKLGYNGFKDFRLDFILANKTVNIPKTSEYKDVILINDDKEFIGLSAIENNVRALEDTIRLFSKDNIDKAAQILMNSRKILLFGKGSSNLVCKDLEMKLRRIDKICLSQDDFDEQLVDSTFIDKRDVVLFVSNSGETPEIVQAAIVAKDNGARIISVVKAGKSTLAELSDVVLYTSALEGEFRSAAMTSRISQLSVIDALYSVCAYVNIERSIYKLEKTYKSFNKYNVKGLKWDG